MADTRRLWGSATGRRIWWVRGALYAKRNNWESNIVLRQSAYYILYHPDEVKTKMGTKIKNLAKLLELDDPEFVQEMEFEMRRKT